METGLKSDELRAALSGAMVVMRYQPIVSLTDRTPIGFEALARLKHPSHGVLTPARFVPQIEKAGLAHLLAEQVLAAVLADLCGPVLGTTHFSAAINLPLEVLVRPETPTQIDVLRQSYGLLADRIVIELTESQPVTDYPRLQAAVEHLRGLGFGVALDDAGPATPDLPALLDLPFTMLKFDHRPVRKAGRSVAADRFFSEMVATARDRGWRTVAEGVTNDETWQHLRALGIDAAQGYLIAAPLGLQAIPKWLAGWCDPKTA